jgi:predicted metallopeptidase
MTIPPILDWDASRPPPRLALRLAGRRRIATGGSTGPVVPPFDFTAAMRALCEDVVYRSAPFAHVDLSRVLFTITRSRNGHRHGLQARVTPLRFRGGELVTIYRGVPYQVQRLTVHGRDMLYLVTFCLPRFLNRDFEDKLVTVFHELYHISPTFDGDLRRHEGRYCTHTASQKRLDAHMGRLVRAYLNDGADADRHAFLRLSFAELCRRHGAVAGLHVPRPKLVRLTPRPRPASPPAPSRPDTPG